jgi:TonB-linked SusC/RagA family outer membrane protein
MKKAQMPRKLKVLVWTFISCLLLSAHGLAQTKRISGKITTRETNEPLQGATVIVKGTNKSTTTNDQGQFTIDANTNDVLVVSFVGFNNQEIRVGASNSVDIGLTRSYADQNEVIVVGYGRMKKTDQSSAQTSISAADIGRTVNTTIEQAIQGRAANVHVMQNTGQPGGGISVNVRGINTINGSNQPLYVIDGIQIEVGNVSYGSTSSINPLAGINPADIESMEILQGPSATAIYGSRATNGVVLITTKRGKAGQLRVGYNYLYSLQDKPDIMPTMTLPQYAQMYNEIRGLTGGLPPGEFRDPSILGEGTNWQEELFKRAPLNKHQLTLSGGSNNTTFYLSGEYFTQEGIAIGSQFDRYSFRLNLDNQTRKWLKLSTNLSFSTTKDKLGTTSENIINTALQMAPNVSVYNSKGEFAGADETNGTSVQFTPLNPVAIANLVQNDLKRYNALGGLTAEVNLIKGLIFRTSINGNGSWGNGRFFSPNYQLGNRPASVASLSLSNSTSLYWNWTQLLQYNIKIGKHDIGLMAGHESQESRWHGLSGSRTGFVSNGVAELGLGNAQGQQNNSYKGSNSMESYLARVNYTYNSKYILQGAFRADGSSQFGPDNRWGYFPSVSAAWRVSEEPFMSGIAFINDLKIRIETGLTGANGPQSGIYSPLNSSASPWGTGFYVGRYGNSALKWEQTRTDNVGFNISMLQNRIQFEGDYYVKKTDNLLLQIPLPDYMGTAGEGSIAAPTVNIGSLENKGWGLTLNTVNLDRNGFQWKTNLNVSHFKTKITSLNTGSAFLDRQPWYIGINNTGFIQRSAIGQEPWLMIGYVQEGIFESVKEIQESALPTKSDGVTELDVAPGGVWVGDIKYRDLNGDGIINHLDQTVVGNPWPELTAGFTNSFSYKGFDLNILFTASFGNDVFNYVRFQNTNPNAVNLGRNMLAETFDYAKPTGDPANPTLSNPGTIIPRLSNGDPNGNFQRFTNAFVEDATYIRLKNVTLGYNLPRSIVSKARVLQGARLSIGVQNLATFTDYKGYDPEVGAYVGREAQPSNQLIGVDPGRYPLTRVYTFSLGVDF